MKDLPATLKIATLWLVLGTAVFLAIQAWQASERQSRVSIAGGAIVLQRDRDGHFHWPGRVNGTEVDFLVDTGATRTTVPEALARALKLEAEGVFRSNTANGTAQGWLARADVQLQGGVHAERLRLAVLPALDSPLLGMDVLAHLRFTQRGDMLRIEAPPAP